MIESINANEYLKNCYALKSIPEIIHGTAGQTEADILFLTVLNGYKMTCINNKAPSVIINDLKTLQNKILRESVWTN